MNPFLSEAMQNLEPYKAGEQPKDKKYIKLNTNENPYEPTPALQKALRYARSLRLYPDPLAAEFCETAGKANGLPADHVFAGNGSDEVLALAFKAFFDSPVLFADITYSFYPVFCEFFKIKSSLVPLQDDFTLDVAGFLKPNGGIAIANPNAPTGIALELKELRTILDFNLARKRVVLIDEAYVAFGAESAVKLIPEYPNLVVVRTLSKSHALAGMRLGYALAQPHLIEGLRMAKDSFNSYPVDSLAQAAGTAALRDAVYYEEVLRRVEDTRTWFVKALTEMGFYVLPSKTNFVFAGHASIKAGELFQRLRDRGVLVRYFDAPRVRDFLRITIGTDGDMQKVAAILQEILS